MLYATPALWRRLAVDAPDLPAEQEERWAAWEAALSCLLHRISGFVAAAEMASRSRREAHWVGSVLQQLQPAAVAELSILAYQLPPSAAALEPLHRLTRLTSLRLSCEGTQAAAASPLEGLAQLLPALPLCSLRLDARGLPDGITAALVQLPALTDLRLVSRAGALPELAPITWLARLRYLHIEDRAAHTALQRYQLPAPAAFPELEHYSLQALLNKNLQARPQPCLPAYPSCRAVAAALQARRAHSPCGGHAVLTSCLPPLLPTLPCSWTMCRWNASISHAVAAAATKAHCL